MKSSRPFRGHFDPRTLCKIAIVLLSGLTAFAACTKKPLETQQGDRARLDRYINQTYSPQLDVTKYLSDMRGIQREYGLRDALRERRSPAGKKKEPEPLPGRLLVQIDPSEIANPFKPVPPRIDLGWMVRAGLLPASLEIERVRYLGQARNIDGLFLVAVRKRYSESDLAAAFRGTKAKRFHIVSTAKARGGVTLIAVSFTPEAMGRDFVRFYKPTFFHLTESSSLRDKLRRLGVVGMRRVFKSVEKPDPRASGCYRVVPFKQLLDLAKQQNPLRTARAYDTVHSKDLNDILAAYQQHYGQAMHWVSDRTIMAAMQSLKPYLRIPVIVPGNMENYFVLTFAPGVDLQAAKEELELHARFKKVSFDYPLDAAATNDPYFGDQWGLENSGVFNGVPGGAAGFDTNAEAGWGAAAPQGPIVVAVVDMGFKENLNELRTRLWTNPHETAGSFADADGNGYVGDVHGITTGLYVDAADGTELGLPSTVYGTHGTEVAGVIAAQADNSVGISGVAGTDDVRLMNLTLGAFSATGTPCGLAEFAQATWYAIAPSTDPDFPLTGADIINASFSGCGIKTYLPQDVIMAALSAGIIIVACAGNDGASFLDLPYSVYPASLPGVVTVGGSQRDGLWWPSSNHGYLIDLVAPAADVVTTSLDPANPSSTQAVMTLSPPASGTSMSAAFVSGGAAVVLGRFGNISGPFMNDWLRAKALDMVDPLGDGANHTGDDRWTGAGMLDIGNAALDALNALDRPIDVEVAMDPAPTHIKEIDAYVPGIAYAVMGAPRIGVRVQGESIGGWQLAYGLGEFPDQAGWTPIMNGSGASQFEINNYGEITSGGITPFDTDSLVQGQFYSLRLQATNGAGTVFNAYRVFRPVRAAITFPSKNYVIVPERGWFPLAGYVRLRTGQSYSVSVTNGAGSSLWSSPNFTNPYTDYPVTSGKFLLLNNRESAVVNPHHYCGDTPTVYTANVPTFPTDLAFLPEGPIHYMLRAGADQDTLRLHVDRSNFPISYWNILNDNVAIDTIYDLRIDDLSQYSTCFHNHDWRNPDQLTIAPPGETLTPRLFVLHIFGVSALDASGMLVWQRVSPEVYEKVTSNILVADLDGAAPSEVVIAESRRRYYGSAHETYLSVLNGNSGAEQYGAYREDLPPVWSIAAANLSGDPGKELVLTHSQSVTAMRRDGSILWTRELGAFPCQAKVADIDGDGWDEILLPGTGLILRRDNTFQSGWSTAGEFGSMDIAREGSTVRIVIGDGSSVYVKALTGATRPGWPVAGTSFVVGKPGTTGDDLIAVYTDRIRTYNLNGSFAAGIPDIIPTGAFGGVELHDVDGDGQKEFVMLMDRYKENPADDELVGNFLEAYRMSGGARLADSDSRWPIHIDNLVDLCNWPMPRWNAHFAIGEVDGSAGLEVVQLLRIAPYKKEYRWGLPGIRIELTHLP